MINNIHSKASIYIIQYLTVHKNGQYLYKIIHHGRLDHSQNMPGALGPLGLGIQLQE